MTSFFTLHSRRAAAAAALVVTLAACGSDGAASTNTSEPAVPASDVAVTDDTTPDATSAPDHSTPEDSATTKPDDAVQAVRDRFVAAMSADPGPLDADAIACIATTVSERLSSPSFEMLVTNLETINEIEDGNQFTDDELLTIATSFAECGDLSDLVDEAAAGYRSPAFVECISIELGDDQFAAAILADLLGENAPGRGSFVLLAGMDGGCSVEARSIIDRAVIDQILSAEQAPILECLSTIQDVDLRPFIAASDLFGMVDFVEQRCT